MTRREALALATAIVSGLFVSTKKVLGAGSEAPQAIDVHQILPVAYESAIAALKRGRDWVHPELLSPTYAHRLRIRHLFSQKVDAGDRLSDVVVPMFWTLKQDTGGTDGAKISIVASLIENSVAAHDFLILDRLKESDCRLTAAKRQTYALGDITYYPQGFYRTTLTTVMLTE